MKCEHEAQEKPSIVSESQGPKYPYNLRLCLYEEQIAKLGLEELPEIDGELMLHAKVKVVMVSKREMEGGKVHRELDLQLVALNLEGYKEEDKEEKAPKKPLANKMYEES